MFISKQLAETIVQRAMSIIHHNVNVIDHNGIIIASGESYRIGEKHGIACKAIRTRKRIVVDTIYQNKTYENVQPGINHPIIIDDQVVLVIGVSGNPVVIERYAELAILAAELLLKQSNEICKINWSYRIRDLLFKQFLETDDQNKCREALQQLISLDVNFDEQLQPVLINIKVNGVQQEKAIDHIINTLSIFTRSQAVILLSNDEILLIFSSRDEQNIVQNIDTFLITQLSHYIIAVGSKSYDANTFKQSFFAVREMINYGIKFCPDKRLLTIEEYAFCGLLNAAKNSPYLLFFDEKIKQLLLSSSGDILIQTLSTFIKKNAQITPTIEYLSIHRNTLNYRLKQVKKLTGLDPFYFCDLMQLNAAIYYYYMKIRELR